MNNVLYCPFNSCVQNLENNLWKSLRLKIDNMTNEKYIFLFLTYFFFLRTVKWKDRQEMIYWCSLMQGYMLRNLSLTWLRHAKLYGKRKIFLYFRSTTPNCQYLTNLNLENSFVTLIWLARNHEQQLKFEYWLAPSYIRYFFLFFHKNGHFWGVRGGGCCCC